jgi:hypothetical protein
MFDSLAELGSPSPTIGGMFPSLAKLGSPGPTLPLGTMFDSLATLGSSSPNPGGALPPLPQPQFANAQADSLPGRRPLADYSTGEILADGGKSFGVGVGRFGIQGAGLLGDIRETIANSAQRAADYFAPGSAPNAGANVSDFLASYPMLAGPTSSQLQSAVEQYTGPFYQPKTIIGDYARTAGEFVPGALLAPEGSLAANAIRYGLLPAFTSETAGQLTQGTAAEPWARTLGGILGAGPGALRELARIRGARDGGVAIEQELAALSQRARQIHDALKPIPRKLRTTAVLSTNGDTIVAGGKRDLQPGQRSLLRPGERPAKLRGAHAEITTLYGAKKAGLIPRAFATTRPICADCAAAIEDAGGVLTSKTTAVFPR